MFQLLCVVHLSIANQTANAAQNHSTKQNRNTTQSDPLDIVSLIVLRIVIIKRQDMLMDIVQVDVIWYVLTIKTNHQKSQKFNIVTRI